jgi:PAS domain S-box-containing protein
MFQKTKQLLNSNTLDFLDLESISKSNPILEVLPEPLFILKEKKLIYINAACEELIGVSKDILKSDHFHFMDIIAPESKKKVLKKANSLKENEDHSVQFDILVSDDQGKPINIEISLRVIKDHSEKVWLGIGREKEKYKQKPRECNLSKIMKENKYELIGKLSSGIVHELNNLLCVIRANTEIVMDNFTNNHDTERELQNIVETCNKASDLTEKILSLTKSVNRKEKPLILNNIISNISKIVKRLFNSNIDINIELDNDLFLIKGKQIEIEQIILNLAINASEAMDKGGELWLRTKNCQGQGYKSPKNKNSKNNNYVCIEVEDTGSGIKEVYKEKIFQPHFIKKGKDGTGLGLALVKNIVEKYQGWIEMDSEYGVGTIFKIFLPVIDV